jgi:hypothetical protein
MPGEGVVGREGHIALRILFVRVLSALNVLLAGDMERLLQPRAV